jgi:hypothetical protein
MWRRTSRCRPSHNVRSSFLLSPLAPALFPTHPIPRWDSYGPVFPFHSASYLPHVINSTLQTLGLRSLEVAPPPSQAGRAGRPKPARAPALTPPRAAAQAPAVAPLAPAPPSLYGCLSPACSSAAPRSSAPHLCCNDASIFDILAALRITLLTILIVSL